MLVHDEDSDHSVALRDDQGRDLEAKMTQSQEEDDDDFSQNSFYFSEQSESESSISEGSKSASDSGDDREFTGDMFMKKKPIKFAAG